MSLVIRTTARTNTLLNARRARYSIACSAPALPPQANKPVLDPRLALRRSVLDAVRGDAADLRARLGINDRIRLDQHLDSIRALENQITALENAAPPPSMCVAAENPGDLDRNNISGINTAMADLLAMSFACDQTRVASIMFSGSVSLQVYGEIGMTTEHHGLSHDEGGDQPKVHAITTFIMAQLNTFLERLDGLAILNAPMAPWRGTKRVLMRLSHTLLYIFGPRSFIAPIIADKMIGASAPNRAAYRRWPRDRSDARQAVGRDARGRKCRGA